jgi:hypothetical protein
MSDNMRFIPPDSLSATAEQLGWLVSFSPQQANAAARQTDPRWHFGDRRDRNTTKFIVKAATNYLGKG